jgi:hypothetical protein
MSGFPILELTPSHLPVKPAAGGGPQPKHPDAHLRSTRSVEGYHVKATDGTNAHVCDFMMDPRSWAIAQLIVKVGHRFSGKEVRMPVRNVNRISYEDSTVFVSLTLDELEKSPASDFAPVARPIGATRPVLLL